jgi:hypothetical protein
MVYRSAHGGVLAGHVDLLLLCCQRFHVSIAHSQLLLR